MSIKSVPLEKAYRLLNHGPVTLVSAQYIDDRNVMAAAWACMLDFDKVSLVLDSHSYTRKLIEKSGYFVLQVPTAQQASKVLALGSMSKNEVADKLEKSRVEFVEIPGGKDMPYVSNAAAWLLCEVIPEEAMQSKYDLFLGKIIGAWADDKVFRAGHWELEGASDALRPLHYTAGGQFYLTGKSLVVKNDVSKLTQLTPKEQE
ncbi:flavin reductase [Psittacicella melopsittaci]|uniref:Flavin reductase n=1 Tax=Psittacicella melopsittaci TaxID=2028576 RepID=A0A3A1Y617_9GAMM|nr:flavin reductase family protein [Psittacicella melopsittaci]RIY32638.1 flavin reductase [Psittacicella melopsittaci]